MNWYTLRRFAVAGGLTVTRTTGTVFSSGYGTPTTEAVVFDPAVVWPIKGTSVVMDGTAIRTQGRIAIGTETQLFEARSDLRGDRFIYEGATWEVQLSRKWEFSNLYYAEAEKIP